MAEEPYPAPARTAASLRMTAAGSDAGRTPSLVQRRAALLAHPKLAVALEFVADASGPAGGAYQHHVGDIDTALLLGDAALDVLLWVGAHVLLHHAHVLHQQLALLGEDVQHAAELLVIFAAPGDDLDHIVLANINSCRVHVLVLGSQNCSYRTSGASETIFKNLFSRSSRATGPKTRVPTGSPASLMSTAAFWSKRM